MKQRGHGPVPFGLQPAQGEPPGEEAQCCSSQGGAKQESAHDIPPRRGEHCLIHVIESWPASALAQQHSP